MLSNRGNGESLGAEPPARPRAEPDGARETAARDAPGMRQKQTRTGGREQAAARGGRGAIFCRPGRATLKKLAKLLQSADIDMACLSDGWTTGGAAV